jgi:hypothetical protein
MQGCFTAGDDDSSSKSGCSKDSDCRDGRICENKVCVNDPNAGAVLGGSSGTNSGTGGASAGTSSTSKGGTGNASSGGSGATGGSAAKGGSGGTTSSGGTGGSSSGTAGSGTSGTSGTCNDADPATCPTADSMTFCSGGTIFTYTCEDYCGTLGYPTGPCSTPDGCACDFNTMSDATCVTAMNVVCNCLDGTSTPCISMPDPNNPDSIIYYPPYIYSACHDGDPADVQFLHCLADQATVMPAPSCQDAFTTCGATGEGGAAGAASQ